jgi:hypothetical protein
MKQDRHPLLRPMFLVALATLIVNDAVLKLRFPGLITGKLSDFAGLFAFTAFWVAFAPRWRWPVAGATALAFMWWKSPLSQPIVDALHLHRTVDVTDVAALIVIPLACAYAGGEQATLRPATLLVALLSVAAFVNTSRPGDHMCCKADYFVPFAKQEALAGALRRLGFHYSERSENGNSMHTLDLKSRVCGSQPAALFAIAPADHGMILRLDLLLYYCPAEAGCRSDCGTPSEAEALAAFEREVIQPLGGRRLKSTPPAPFSPSPAGASPSAAPPPE